MLLITWKPPESEQAFLQNLCSEGWELQLPWPGGWMQRGPSCQLPAPAAAGPRGRLCGGAGGRAKRARSSTLPPAWLLLLRAKPTSWSRRSAAGTEGATVLATPTPSPWARPERGWHYQRLWSLMGDRAVPEIPLC